MLVSRSNFCGSGETSALEVNVTAVPPNNLTIAGEGAVCQENSYTYTLPNIEGVTYSWSVTGGEVKEGQGTSAVDITWNQVGEQKITVTQENYCGRAEPIEKVIAVSSTPQSPLGIDGEIRAGLGEQVYEIEAVVGLNYRWSISDGGRIVSGQGSGKILVIWEKEGDFELFVEAQNGCGFSSKRILAVNVNIITALEPSNDGTMKIYPNPSQGELTISSSNLDSWSSVLVFNSNGQQVMEIPILAGQAELYLNGLPKGLLVIQFQGKNGVLSKKVRVR